MNPHEEVSDFTWQLLPELFFKSRNLKSNERKRGEKTQEQYLIL